MPHWTLFFYVVGIITVILKIFRFIDWLEGKAK